jgi:hypothetical protein
MKIYSYIPEGYHRCETTSVSDERACLRPAQMPQGQVITVPEFPTVPVDTDSLDKLEPLKHGDH